MEKPTYYTAILCETKLHSFLSITIFTCVKWRETTSKTRESTKGREKWSSTTSVSASPWTPPAPEEVFKRVFYKIRQHLRGQFYWMILYVIIRDSLLKKKKYKKQNKHIFVNR